MGEAVGTDPLPENVAGSVVEKHTWNHEVQHSVQWDHVLLAVVAVAVLWFVFGGSSGVEAGLSESDDTASPAPFSG